MKWLFTAALPDILLVAYKLGNPTEVVAYAFWIWLEPLERLENYYYQTIVAAFYCKSCNALHVLREVIYCVYVNKIHDLISIRKCTLHNVMSDDLYQKLHTE